MQDAKESLGIDQSVVHVVVDAVQLTYGGADVGEEHDVIHDLAYRHAGIVYQHEVGRQDDNEHRTNLLQKAFQTVEEVALLAGVQL